MKSKESVLKAKALSNEKLAMVVGGEKASAFVSDGSCGHYVALLRGKCSSKSNICNCGPDICTGCKYK